MNESLRPDCEVVLSQADWVRALARQLTADTHLADDLAQDALAAAVEQSPPNGGSLRAWLAGILRNLARHERRSAASRNARERSVARSEADLSQASLLERLDTHRIVVEAVARLEEPYRAAILMRYFEGLPPAAIAARTGTPLRTVHTRLSRALARLRVELDRAHGGERRNWLLALIPFARGSEGWSVAAIGALVMDAKLKIALAAIVVVGVCSTIFLLRNESQVAPAAIAAAPGEIELATQTEPDDDARIENTRAIVERTAEEPVTAVATPAPPVAEQARLFGRVIDLERAPVAGIQVRFFDAEHRAKDGYATQTDAAGTFELDDPRCAGHLDVDSAGWTSIFRPEFAGAPKPRECVLVVARSVALSGVVVDELRRPIDAANVAVLLPQGLRARFDTILDSSSTVERSGTTDADGRFQLAGVPIVRGAELRTTHAVHLADHRAVPEHDQLAFEIVLRSAHDEPAQLIGQVVDLAGNPVEGAWVGLGAVSAKSGTQGEFSLALGSETDRDLAHAGAVSLEPLRAVKQGYLPAELARPAGNAWPEPLILRLGEAPLAITGQVVDADGRPVANATVWTDDETRFGYIAIESGEMQMTAGANIEGILRGDPWTRRVQTKSDGSFAIEGLLPRDYRVIALDTRHLLVAKANIPAGSRDVELRMPKEDVYERVAGRVTNLAGAPLAGVHVVLERELEGGSGSPLDRLSSRAATTDADGRFEFSDISRALTTIRLSGEQLAFDDGIPISPETDVEKLALAVPIRVHVQVDVGEQTDFDRVALLDARGEKLYVMVHHGNSAYAMQDVELQGTRTETFSVSESGTTLVLYKGDVELRRVPVKLVPGELNTLRP